MASTVEAKIRDAASRNTELQAILAETDHVPPALVQQQRYIADLQNEVANAQKRLKELEWKRQKELTEHQRYRDSVMKRFAFKVSGKKEKFDERAAKEEREYFDVLQQEHQATETKKNVERMLNEAVDVRRGLEQQDARHRQAQTDLDNLYDSIFTGPTPGFPEEDARENEARAALQEYLAVRAKAESEARATKLLTEAQIDIRQALVFMGEALRQSTRDMWGGGRFTDMMERNMLARAEVRVTNARMLVGQAQRFSPAVKSLPRVEIAQGDLMMDVFFDNIFTDMMFHQKIEQSNAEVQKGAMAVDENLQEAAARQAQLSSEIQAKTRRLEEARLALQKARNDAFQRIVVGAPPPYSSTEDIPAAVRT